jgi:uncharacterized protein YutE (UPF0331/DUF86 family)
MNQTQIDLLEKELELLNDEATTLDRSFNNCRKIGLKDEYSFEELDHFEALTRRFARLSDIITQKLLRLIDEIDLETPGTIRDRINRAEKKEIIASADNIASIRQLRNSIAHEYLPKIIQEIFRSVMQWTPELLDTVERIKRYCERYTTS